VQHLVHRHENPEADYEAEKNLKKTDRLRVQNGLEGFNLRL
jgi:hypothetical protein